MANQGNADEKRAHTGVDMKNEHAKKWQKDSRVITGEKCRAFMQHVASGITYVPAIDVIHM